MSSEGGTHFIAHNLPVIQYRGMQSAIVVLLAQHLCTCCHPGSLSSVSYAEELSGYAIEIPNAVELPEKPNSGMDDGYSMYSHSKIHDLVP